MHSAVDREKRLEYRPLGSSGLLASLVGLGGNTFGRSCDAAATEEIVNTALDLGVTFIDTADSYSDGRSEEYIGKALGGRREEAIVATKTGWPGHPGERGLLSRRRLINAVDGSLRRLGTDYLDLFYLHHPDPLTPFEESLSTLDDLIHAGKVRYVGCSNYPGWEIATMSSIAERVGTSSLVASQSEYSLVARVIEEEVIPSARWHGLGIVAYAPLASGFLTGKYRRGEPVPPGVRGSDNPNWQHKRLTEANFDVLEQAEEVAQRHSRHVTEVAIAWVAAQPAVSTVLVGATSPNQVEANVKAVDWRLPEEDVDRLDRS